ncbi:sugar phosphate isomerase/epimerase family protein [Streptomyces sp. NPDC059255]|uniref:sugar phosphate isomerase/epimerase family protein n=1 Tax=unclassified Streptomyces TaxID=2593676 RepID=UPI0036745F90
MNRVVVAPGTRPAEVVRAAHRAGFLYLEMSASRLKKALEEDRHLGGLMGSGGIVPVHGGWSLRLGWERERFASALDAVEREMEFVARLGSRGGTLVLPRQAALDQPPIPCLGELGERVGTVARLAARYGLDLVLEFIGTGPDTDDGYLTLDDARGLIADQGPNVGVLLDTCHWHASGGVVADLASLADRPLFVHLNDAPDAERATLTDTMRLLPGHGVIDLTGCLGALAQGGYRGPVSIELKNPALHALAPADAARAAYAAGAALLRSIEADVAEEAR